MRNTISLLCLTLLVSCWGCGWSTPASKHNTLTGVSESGYPKGSPADAGSPALGTLERPHKEKTPGNKEAKTPEPERLTPAH